MDGTGPNIPHSIKQFPLLFEMMRSFTMLAKTLNLSQAVRELNSTRQTVRRHISLLEEAFDAPLFDVRDRQYELTDLGRRLLPDAHDIQARANAWVAGQLSAYDGLPHLQAQHGEWDFFQQQHPIGRVWREGNQLLTEALRAWSMSEGQIEHPAFQHIRPFTIIYRQNETGWICVEFGERSFYVGWFGADFAKSSIGRPLGKMPGGEEFALMLNQPFHEVQQTQSVRLDHIYTQVPRPGFPDTIPVAYQRLMMCSSFPDGSLAVISLVLPTQDIEIAELDKNRVLEVENLAPVVFENEDLRLSSFEN